jgi:deazaflavin-dependent oxidoreductase (nitroreductase family)
MAGRHRRVSAPDRLDGLDVLGSEPFCYVTTTGRRTGRPHTIEIWFSLLQRTIYLLSGGGDRSDWVLNLKATSAVGVRIGDRTFEATARVVTEPMEDGTARRLLATKYQAWREGRPLSDWAGTALPVAVDLRPERP